MPYYQQQAYPVQQYPQQAQPPQYPVQQAPAAYGQPYPQQYPYAYPQYQVQQAPAPYGQPYAQPYFQPQISPEQQKEQSYRRSLRKSVNGLGALLLIFFGLELVIGTVITVIIQLQTGSVSELTEASDLFLLENGVLSSLIFFVAALIYCFIKRISFAEIFPFEKVGGAKLIKLCVIGLSFSLMSNYVVDLLNNTFGLFGIENTGGSFDTSSDTNILLYFLTVAILPAFVEEFAFRGVIMGILRPYSAGLAIIISSAAFALMHGNFVQLPFTFCCGAVFAYIDIKCNSLLPSIIIHFLNNGLSVAFDVLIAYGVMNEYLANACYGLLFVITGILSFIFIKKFVAGDDGSMFRLDGGDDTMSYKSKVKTAVTSPTLIVFASVMLSYCILSLLPISL